MAEHATYYGLYVRRIRRGTGMDADLVIQRKNPMTGQWYDVRSFSELYDFAYSDSHKCAWSLAASIGRDGFAHSLPRTTKAA